MKNIVVIASTFLVLLCLFAMIQPVSASSSKIIYTGMAYPPAVDGVTGSVTGSVRTAGNATTGIGGATVSIVSAMNVTAEYYNTTSNAFGEYAFTGVNATFNNVRGYGYNIAGNNVTGGNGLVYKIYAYASMFGDGYSNPFGVDSSTQPSAVPTSVVIFTRPVTINLMAERNMVLANGQDNIKVTATMYDALGHRVGDGYKINFTVGNMTNNAWYNGFDWTTDNGSFNGGSQNVNARTVNSTGSAIALFGWVPSYMEGFNSTIWAYYADDPSINTSIIIAAVNSTTMIDFNDGSHSRIKYTGIQYPSAIDGVTGSVTGNVRTAGNATSGIGGARISIVSAMNITAEYFNTTSNSFGEYAFTGVNATFNNLLGYGYNIYGNNVTGGNGLIYKIYAYAGQFGDGYSNPIGIDSSSQPSAVPTSVIIVVRPAKIILNADTTQVNADGNSSVKVTATMYDILGHLVADGFRINFTVGNTTNNEWLNGFSWTSDDGSFNNGSQNAYVTAINGTGSGSVKFGCMPPDMSGKSSTVWAYYNDDPSVNASITITAINPGPAINNSIGSPSRILYTGIPYPPAIDGATGSVTGIVMTAGNVTTGVGGAIISIVSAMNVTAEYYNTTSNAFGEYALTGVNATFNNLGGYGYNYYGNNVTQGNGLIYKIYAYAGNIGDGYSNPFGIDSSTQPSAVPTSVIIFTKPVSIELKADRTHVNAYGNDTVRITATMYDALGHLVADGYNVNFTVGNATDNAWLNGYPWTPDNGSLNFTSSYHGNQASGGRDMINSPTKNGTGSAIVDFGWVPSYMDRGNSTVWAYCRDNPAINASIKIDFYDQLIPSFTSNITSGFAPLTVEFNDTSAGNPTSWQWNFGDNSTVVTSQNATHIFDKPGIYHVSMFAANSFEGLVNGSVIVVGDQASVSNTFPQSIDGIEGGVTGAVMMSDFPQFSVSGAYISIVNASNTSQVYCNTTADAFGIYYFVGVNATFNSIANYGYNADEVNITGGCGQVYRIYARTEFHEGYSDPFGIDSAPYSNVKSTIVYVKPRPVSILLTAEKPNVIANGQDFVKIKATLYDRYGLPVADGNGINFTIGNTTSNAWLNGFNYSAFNGSLDNSGQYAYAVTGNYDGSGSVLFGWVPPSMDGGNSIIWAYDSDDPAINASINIDFGYALIAKFTAYNMFDESAPSVQFNDTSIGNPTAWEWNFGDNSTNATTQNVTHTFPGNGYYNVTLTVFNSSLSNTTTRHVYASKYVPITIPYLLYGYVDYNGVPVNGADVRITGTDNNYTSTDDFNGSKGYYQLCLGIEPGKPLVVNLSASYNGSMVRSADVTLIPGGCETVINLSIVDSVTLSLHQGWNLISSPLVLDQALNVSIFKGTNVIMVARYNHTTGGFDIYRVGKTPVAFPFEAGQGYFLYCSSGTEYTINGYSKPGQSVTICQGWNLIGWTNMTGSDTKLIASGLQNVTMLAKYNTTTGSYDIYRVGKTPIPFDIKPGEGYFLYTTYASLQTLVT